MTFKPLTTLTAALLLTTSFAQAADLRIGLESLTIVVFILQRRG